MKNIYVGNLDFDATEESIRSLFASHGTVEKVHLATDRETGRSRGFRFRGDDRRRSRQSHRGFER